MPNDSSNSAYLASIENVNATIAFMTQKSTEWMERTQQAIEALGAWHPYGEAEPPRIELAEIEPRNLPHLDAPDPAVLGEVADLQNPAWEDLRALVGEFDPYDPGPFNPTTALPSIPPPPSPIDTSGKPTRPTINEVVLPPDPDLTLPAMDALDAIVVPPMPVITIPPLDIDDIPTFDTDPPTLDFHWTEGAYTPLVVHDVADTVRAMLAGGFAMPPSVQAALLAAARDREDLIERKAVQDAYDDFAARGFDMPPGMLAEQVNVARERNLLQANTFNRQVYTQAAQWAIENLRTAVAQGIALEGMWSQHWNQIQQRAFEAARITVEVAKDQFNLIAAAFNLKMQRIAVIREVFDAKLRAEMAKLDILKAQLEAEALKGTLNEQKVRVFATRLEGLRVLAQIFSEKLNATKIRADNERAKIETYKVDVEAWGEKIRADKARFEAYEAQVRGESAKVGAYEAEARAYAATVQAASDRNNARIGIVNAKLRAIEASVQKFLGLLQASVAVVTASRDQISARAQAYTADTARYSEQLRYESTNEELRIRAKEASLRNNLAFFDTISRQFDGRMQRLLQMSVAIKDALTSAGQMTAQMAAGAMSAIHASASISGSGSVNTGYSYSWNMTPSAEPSE